MVTPPPGTTPGSRMEPSGVIQFAEYAQEDLTFNSLPPLPRLSELQLSSGFPKGAKPIWQTQWMFSTGKTHLQTLLCLHWRVVGDRCRGRGKSYQLLLRDFATPADREGARLSAYPAVRQLLHWRTCCHANL